MRKLFAILFVILIAAVAVIGIVGLGAADPTPAYLGQFGSDGSGPGQFNFVIGIDHDAAGNLYCTDLDGRIQKFSASGVYLTQWGSDGSDPGQFSSPTGVAVGSDGSVFIADQGNHRVQKFAADGTFLLSFGSSGTGPGQFRYPYDVDVSHFDHLVRVTDQLNGRIQVFDENGAFLGIVGSGLNQGYGIASDPQTGDVYVVISNASNISRVMKFSAAGTFLLQWGTGGSGPGQFNHPVGIAVDDFSRVYVADKDNHRIQMFNGSGGYLTEWGSLGSNAGQFNLPYCLTENNGLIHVTDDYNHRVQAFGNAATAASPTTWGRLKSLYR